MSSDETEPPLVHLAFILHIAEIFPPCFNADPRLLNFIENAVKKDILGFPLRKWSCEAKIQFINFKVLTKVICCPKCNLQEKVSELLIFFRHLVCSTITHQYPRFICFAFFVDCDSAR